MEAYKQKLLILRTVYGKNVLCTNGLFHIIDESHKEIYINCNTGELDRRGRYRTIVVTDRVIVAEVLNDIKIKYVILKKSNLECIYKSTSEIKYLDKNLLYDITGTLISHTGKELMRLNKIRDIKKVYNGYYLIKTTKMFDDKLVKYIDKSDRLTELTHNKNYALSLYNERPDIIDIHNMYGGRYRYNIKTHEYINLFTMERDEDIQLWTLN